MYKIYLTDEDLKVGSNYLVIALINEAANEDIICFLKNLLEGVGSGYNYTNCYFWNELDDFDKNQTPFFDGLAIENENGEEYIASLKEVTSYLEILQSRMTLNNEETHLMEQLISELSNVGNAN